MSSVRYAADQRRVLIPADACYWACLPATAGRLPTTAQCYQAEAVWPVDSDTVHAASTTTADGQVVLCAVDRGRLQELLAQYPRVVSIRPEALPAHLAADLAPSLVEDLELASGAWAPPALRRWALAGPAIVGLGGLFVGVILAVGWWESAGQWAEAATQQRDHNRRLAESVLPEAQGAERQVPPLMRLQSAWRAHQARSGAEGGLPRDARLAAAALTNRWPGQTRIQVHSWQIDANGMQLRARLPSLKVAQELAGHWRQLRDAEGRRWVAEAPRTEQVRDGAELSLHWQQGDGE